MRFHPVLQTPSASGACQSQAHETMGNGYSVKRSHPQVARPSTATTALLHEVASLKREVERLHDDRLAAPQPRSMATSGGTVLAFALGGSSDVIGALAWARACGYERLVLVQPGSPPRGAASTSLELQPVPPEAPGTPAPGGSFFDNGSMVAYLLSLDATQLVAGYYLVQPKDDGGGKGFSRASLEGTTAALVQALAAHECSAIVGVDFGGDVALPDKKTQRGACRERGPLTPPVPLPTHPARTSPLPRPYPAPSYRGSDRQHSHAPA